MTASSPPPALLIGVAAANASHASLIVTGMAGLVAGAMSMAAGEYVSVHSQADTEHADLARERAELASNPKAEHRELANIYMQRGVSPELAHQVADQLMAHDALGAHARDELGISEALTAKPLQAALASAASFVVGAALPLAVTLIAPEHSVVPWICGMSPAVSCQPWRRGGQGRRGEEVFVGAWRVTLWGVLAMGITASVGALFGAVV